MSDDDDRRPTPSLGEDLRPGVFVDGKSKRRFKTQKQRSKKQERRIAKEIGGKRSSTSGAVRTKGYTTRGSSGDVTAAERGFKVEAKYTDNASFRITEDVIAKIMVEAAEAGQDWVIQADIYGFKSNLVPQSVAILDWDKFIELTGGHEDE